MGRSGAKELRSRVVGSISSAAFASGDQYVIGCWNETPVGPICDVMWLDSDNRRTLIVPSDTAAEFITSIYTFDNVSIAPLKVAIEKGSTFVATDDLAIEIHGGLLRPVPLWRPLWITRHVEAPIARLLMGVETYGTSPTGAKEWYQTRGWRWATSATATRDGEDLGAMVPIDRPMNVGFSNPPIRGSVVAVSVTIDQPRSSSARIA